MDVEEDVAVGFNQVAGISASGACGIVPGERRKRVPTAYVRVACETKCSRLSPVPANDRRPLCTSEVIRGEHGVCPGSGHLPIGDKV